MYCLLEAISAVFKVTTMAWKHYQESYRTWSIYG